MFSVPNLLCWETTTVLVGGVAEEKKQIKNKIPVYMSRNAGKLWSRAFCLQDTPNALSMSTEYFNRNVRRRVPLSL